MLIIPLLCMTYFAMCSINTTKVLRWRCVLLTFTDARQSKKNREEKRYEKIFSNKTLSQFHIKHAVIVHIYHNHNKKNGTKLGLN